MADVSTDPCCAPEQQATCCEPSTKAGCCGHGEGCGCEENVRFHSGHIEEIPLPDAKVARQ